MKMQYGRPPATPDADLAELRLKPREERRLVAGHLWVFSNEVDSVKTPLPAFEPGGFARVTCHDGRFLGYASVSPHALICARILSRDARFPPGKALFVHRIRVALALRERLYGRPYYRLVYGESDGLPGLVLDRFDDVIVGQTGTASMEAMQGDVQAALESLLRPRAIIWKNDSGARDLENLPKYTATVVGKPVERIAVEENGVCFEVPVGGGQKTGWFYDQAANRAALLKYVPGTSVLDVFSYVGAWGLSAARAGAREVTCVDSSASALEALRISADKNALAVAGLQGDAFETMESLRARGMKFDVVVIDPPAFIKRRRDAAKGIAAYRKLNRLAMQLLPRDGILVSCSCSHHLAEVELVNAIQRSARHLGRFAQIVEIGGQAPDHPIHPAMPETRYLKAIFCRIVKD